MKYYGKITDDKDLITKEKGSEIAQSEISTAISSGSIKTELDKKQESLISGTNIKTINGNSVLGAGNITIASSLGFEEVE